jgi:hypothetical protein
MPGVDERIRSEMDRLARPVEMDGALDRIRGRRARRRVVHRVQVVALAVFVLAGTAAGGYGLTRLFAPAPEGVEPARSPEASVPPPEDTPAPDGTELCDTTASAADLDGDGQKDLVIVYAPVDVPGSTECESDQVGLRYEARVTFGFESEGGGFVAEPQPLPECDGPFQCKLFATPDLDADGRAEVAITIYTGGPALYFAIYRLDPDWNLGDAALERLQIAPPGDPWHEEWGSPPGPAMFLWYGSVTHQHSVGCTTHPDGRRTISVKTGLRTEEAPGPYDVHITALRLEGATLLVEGSYDFPAARAENDDPGPWVDFENGEELCGAPFVEW